MAEHNNNESKEAENEQLHQHLSGDFSERFEAQCQICPQGPEKGQPSLHVNGFIKDPRVKSIEEPETFLYDPELIKKLDFTQSTCKFNPMVSAANPGEGLAVRPLGSRDYERGFLEILGQLTSVGKVTKEDFIERFNQMKACKNTYFITVIVDTKLDKIIGSGTIVHEQKFIHECGSRGIIEDIIVSDQYRGKQLGKIIIASLVEIGKAIGCYKITLNCKDNLIKFYNNFGLVCEPGNANFMMLRIPSKL